MYYVLSVIHVSYLCVCFVNISVYISDLSNLFYTTNFVSVDVNIDAENSMHNDLVICNNFINYKVLSAFDFDFIGLESSGK